MMNKQYVEKSEGGYRIAGTRVSLDSIVYAYLEGLRPESIADDFPALTLEEVYEAIAYYLGQTFDPSFIILAGHPIYFERRTWESCSQAPANITHQSQECSGFSQIVI